MGIIFGLLAALGTGISLVLIKRSYKELPASVAFAFQAIFGLILWIPFALYVGITFQHFGTVLLLAFISAILSEAFYYYIFSKASVGLTGAAFSTYPVFTIFFALLIISERPPVGLWPFLALTILGVIVMSLPDKLGDRIDKRKALFWGLLGALVVGLADTLSKGIIDKTSAATFLFALAIMQVPVAVAFLIVQKQSIAQFKQVIMHFKVYIYSALGALIGTVGLVFLWLTFEATYASVASPLTAIYPGFTAILAYLYLKERISKRDALGIAIIVAGVAGISYFV